MITNKLTFFKPSDLRKSRFPFRVSIVQFEECGSVLSFLLNEQMGWYGISYAVLVCLFRLGVWGVPSSSFDCNCSHLVCLKCANLTYLLL